MIDELDDFIWWYFSESEVGYVCPYCGADLVETVSEYGARVLWCEWCGYEREI